MLALRDIYTYIVSYLYSFYSPVLSGMVVISYIWCIYLGVLYFYFYYFVSQYYVYYFQAIFSYLTRITVQMFLYNTFYIYTNEM